MGWSYRKSAKFGPIRVNASKRGVGYSVGGRGFRLTKRADGRTQRTISIPGSGLRHTSTAANAGCLMALVTIATSALFGSRRAADRSAEREPS